MVSKRQLEDILSEALEDYTFSEILDNSGLTELEVLILLFDAGMVVLDDAYLYRIETSDGVDEDV